MAAYHARLLVTGVLFCGLVLAGTADAQWVNRYSKLADFNHHVYLEQHELPILAHGPTDPAPSPDGSSLAFAARGWIWQLDLESGTARRLTSGPAVDSRPRWSPDGQRLALVRDDGSDTAIVILDINCGEEQVIDTPTIELDPEFSADGEYVYYTSGVGDKLSLWQRHLASGAEVQLTDLPQVERNARRLPSGDMRMTRTECPYPSVLISKRTLAMTGVPSSSILRRCACVHSR